MDLTLARQIAARAIASRPRRHVTATVRQPSLASRYLDSLRARVADGSLAAGAPVVLRDDVAAWCEAHYPAQAGRLTPHATVEAQIRVVAKAGALPVDIELVSARDVRAILGDDARRVVLISVRTAAETAAETTRREAAAAARPT